MKKVDIHFLDDVRSKVLDKFGFFSSEYRALKNTVCSFRQINSISDVCDFLDSDISDEKKSIFVNLVGSFVDTSIVRSVLRKMNRFELSEVCRKNLENAAAILDDVYSMIYSTIPDEFLKIPLSIIADNSDGEYFLQEMGLFTFEDVCIDSLDGGKVISLKAYNCLSEIESENIRKRRYARAISDLLHYAAKCGLIIKIDKRFLDEHKQELYRDFDEEIEECDKKAAILKEKRAMVNDLFLEAEKSLIEKKEQLEDEIEQRTRELERLKNKIILNEHPEKINEIYALSIEELDLTVGAFNRLKRGGIRTIGDVVSLSQDELINTLRFRRRDLADLKERLTDFGLY